MIRKKPALYVLSAIVLVAFLTSGYYIFTAHNPFKHGMSSLAVNQSAANKLPKRSPQLIATHLAAGLLPPTNKWFSSLAFSNQNLPIYAYPLSFEPTNLGYSISNPPVVSSNNAIYATHIDDISVNFGATKQFVQQYDDLSVTDAETNNNNQVLGLTTITHGSPYVFTRMQAKAVVQIVSSGSVLKMNQNEYLITVGNRPYGVYTTAASTNTANTITIAGNTGALVTVFTLPSNAPTNLYFTDASHPIVSTSVQYNVTQHFVSTVYTLHTAAGKTLFAYTPNMSYPNTNVGVYQTLLGAQPVEAGNTFTDQQTVLPMPSAQLDLSKITVSQKKQLISLLTTDTNTLNFTQTDTYFSGKELYRAANLLEIAESLHQTALANKLIAALNQRLSEWLDPNGYEKRSDLYFYYDTSYKGVVGVKASFGSDSFNDHDFHYGYFIYAAAVLSQYDPSFYSANNAMVNVLISDIAATSSSALFPKLRYFDPYVGHSWASGTGEFEDGNNQESSSEAINAWYAMYLWSQVSHNTALQNESVWLYSHETKAAQTQWLSVSSSNDPGAPYLYQTAGIIWGDKIDHSTFFSSDNQSILGIQLIPMSPGQNYLTNTNITSNVNSVNFNSENESAQFSDYMIMYTALSNPTLALKQAESFSPESLDSANSMTYFYAYLFAHQQ